MPKAPAMRRRGRPDGLTTRTVLAAELAETFLVIHGDRHKFQLRSQSALVRADALEAVKAGRPHVPFDLVVDLHPARAKPALRYASITHAVSAQLRAGWGIRMTPGQVRRAHERW